ncbi:MAG TPA: DUF4157 domain-containing protein [Albitalea sp.]|nr:DUF4157 domain-containing protein [Albitalea sp.]
MSQRATPSRKPTSSLLSPAPKRVLQRRCACGGASEGECAECARKKDTKGTLQRKAQSVAAVAQVPAAVHEVLQSPGQALGDDVRGAMEHRFGHDFSDVRVHADARAAASARAVDAAAYTVGRDVVFGAQQFAPSTAGGQKLLAHELAHVVQQGGSKAAGGEGLTLGAAGDAHEAQADRAAEQVMRGGGAPALGSAGAAVQRAPLGSDAPVLSSMSSLPERSLEIAGEETISADNPKLVEIAGSFKTADSSARIEISASLTESAKLSSAGEQAERSRLWGRMKDVRDALVALGVPRDRIDLSAPTAYSTSAHGQVEVSLRKPRSLLLPAPGIAGLPPLGTGPSFGPKTPPPVPAAKTPSLSDLLTLKFGPVTIELPKSIKARLPIPISAAKSLVIELQAEAPAKFGFKITLDGTPYVRVSASAGAEYDTDKKQATGSAGLQIESVKTTCHAVNPEETRSKIKTAGDKLMKAAQEYSAATDSDTKEGKLIEIAGAVGEMYDAVDKAKAACKQVPRFKLEFGVKGPLGTGGDDSDPSKRPATVLGGTLTIPF